MGREDEAALATAVAIQVGWVLVRGVGSVCGEGVCVGVGAHMLWGCVQVCVEGWPVAEGVRARSLALTPQHPPKKGGAARPGAGDGRGGAAAGHSHHDDAAASGFGRGERMYRYI